MSPTQGCPPLEDRSKRFTPQRRTKPLQSLPRHRYHSKACLVLIEPKALGAAVPNPYQTPRRQGTSPGHSGRLNPRRESHTGSGDRTRTPKACQNARRPTKHPRDFKSDVVITDHNTSPPAAARNQRERGTPHLSPRAVICGHLLHPLAPNLHQIHPP